MDWTSYVGLTIKRRSRWFRWESSSRRSWGGPKKRWMDCVEEDLHRVGISRYGITTGRQRVSLREIAGDKSMESYWRHRRLKLALWWQPDLTWSVIVSKWIWLRWCEFDRLLEHCTVLQCELARCGAVYCNRSCLWVCLCADGSVTTITRNCVHRSSPNWVCIGKGSDPLQLIKFW